MARHAARVPRLVAGVDVTKLPLSPLEGFVLSRIDGMASVSLLADLTHLDAEQVGAIVERLIELGAVEWARESVSLPRATGRPATPTSIAPSPAPEPARPATASMRPSGPRPARTTADEALAAPSAYKAKEPVEEHVDTSRASVRPGATPRASHTGALHPPGELEDLDRLESGTPPTPEPLRAQETDAADDDIDLDPERRRRIDELYVALELLDHYQVLGLERTASREEVRTAYFTRSKSFHPDTMFRKRLGPYKAKMESIFTRLTEAYEVLGKKRSREEYDRYLALQDRTREVEAVLDAAPLAPAPRAGGAADSEPPEPQTPEPRAPATASFEPRPEVRARARALMARQLRAAARASEAGRVRTASAPAPEHARRERGDVVRELASSLKSAANHTGGLDRAQRHLVNARRAERDGDLATAACELRLAIAIAPERDDLRAEHARVNALLTKSLASTYEAQAEYEQRHGKWAAAAVSWAKVAAGRPDDPRPARLAAEALLAANGDLHRAKELAQRAVDLAPGDASNLRVLGRVYAAAGLKLNARRVLRQAAALDPSDRIVETLLRELDGSV